MNRGMKRNYEFWIMNLNRIKIYEYLCGILCALCVTKEGSNTEIHRGRNTEMHRGMKRNYE